MKRILFIGLMLLTAGVMFVVALPARAQVAGEAASGSVALEAALPASLDALYPPNAAAPIYHIRMIEMAGSMSGLVSDLMEGDGANVKADFEAFRSAYVALREMVPEWIGAYPMPPLEDLGRALEGGSQGDIMASLQRAGKACSDCHEATMARVQQKYQWGNFAAIRLQDPLSQRPVGFAEFMHYLDAGLVGIALNLRQGQPENAQNSYKTFAARFDAFSQTCFECHDSERRYFVDAEVRAMISEIGKALEASPPDMQAIASLSEGIGMESCVKCHRVHIPAAMAQARLQRAATPAR